MSMAAFATPLNSGRMEVRPLTQRHVNSNETMTLAQFLRARYVEALETADRFTLQEVATAAGYSQAYITQLHAGSADTAVPKWPGEKAVAFLRAHRFTTTEIRAAAERFDLGNILMYLDYVRVSVPLRVKEGSAKVRFLGSVSAGRFGTAFVDDEGEYVDVPAHVLRHHDVADIFALDVTGDSMVTDDARGAIPPGARAYFHARLRPSPGQVVCCRLTASDDLSVIKVYRPGQEFTTLESINRKHRPIVVDADNPAKLEGVLIGVSIPF
jgi:SOS-response transcriptional repressor LexA